MVLFLCMLTSLAVYSQGNILDRKIDIRFEYQSIDEALTKIEKEVGCTITYRLSETPKRRRITKVFKKTTLRVVIQEVWGSEHLSFLAIGNDITIQVVQQKKIKSQPGNLQGYLIDDRNESIPFATVAIKGTGKGAVTDESGHFEMKGIPEGSYILAISSMGYEPKEQQATIRPNKTTSLNIIVPIAMTALDEVVVEGQSQEVKELIESAQAVVVVETRAAKVQTADLGEVIARTQGVNIQRTGGLGSQAQFSLNGLSKDQIRFFLNGIPLDAMGYINGLANVPVNLIDRVEIYRGVVPIRFGADALGGAVNIISNEGFEGTGGSASYQLGSFGTHRLALNVNHRPTDKTYFINVSGFYDRSKNNYKINVDIPDARGNLTNQTVERFHDKYLSRGMNLEFGIRNKEWADMLMIRGFYTKINQDLQHNFIMTVPYGEATSGATSMGGLLKWEKRLKNKLTIENTMGFARNETQIVDTASFVYQWNGQLARDLQDEIIIRAIPGERGSPSEILFKDKLFYNRFYTKYAINQNHEIRFSSAPTYEAREGENALLDAGEVDRLTLDNELFSFINGVEYEYKSTGDQLMLIGFVKNYTQHLITDRIDLGGELFESDRKTNNYGAGASLRYHLNDNWQIKTSYERATRLPNLFEVFGDGFFVTENVSLKPERSHNVNLSAKLKSNLTNKAYLNVELNAFLRQVEDFIQLLGTNNFFVHRNIANVSSRGLELSSRWSSPGKRMELEATGTYISYINSAETGPFVAFEGDRLPNRPYLFASTSGRYSFKNLLSENEDLVLFVNMRFVNQFFRSWESVGRRDSKQVIPSQFTQNFGLTYTTLLKNQRLSFTAEMQNVSNAEVFDFFGVQRPGRAFYMKSILNF